MCLYGRALVVERGLECELGDGPVLELVAYALVPDRFLRLGKAGALERAYRRF